MKISKAEWAAILAACIVVAFSLGYYLGRSASPAVLEVGPVASVEVSASAVPQVPAVSAASSASIDSRGRVVGGGIPAF